VTFTDVIPEGMVNVPLEVNTCLVNVSPANPPAPIVLFVSVSVVVLRTAVSEEFGTSVEPSKNWSLAFLESGTSAELALFRQLRVSVDAIRTTPAAALLVDAD
jgi:hypothetical protein